MSALLTRMGGLGRGRWSGAARLGLALGVVALGLSSAALTDRLHPPGRWIDIGGRRMHIVCEGPKLAGQPTVLFESGAFGFSADWAVVQARLTRLGVHSCAYDRAGLGFSDPGPSPRDGLHVAADLEQTLRGAGEAGPFVLVSHSMAGLYVRLFADRNPARVAGLVLVDSTTPEAMDDRTTRDYVGSFTLGAKAAATAGSLGLMLPLRGSPLANKIGLTAEAEIEKRHMFASGAYNRAAAAEVEQWPQTALEARRSGRLDPDWPVAVISAGLAAGPMRDVQAAPALGSSHGSIDIVPGASHDALLGPRFADVIVRRIVSVMQAAARPAPPVTVASQTRTSAGGPSERR
jgi:pimeloyl-ACP methyl ester carboxylesterase